MLQHPNAETCWIIKYFRNCFSDLEKQITNPSLLDTEEMTRKCDEKVQDLYRTLRIDCQNHIGFSVIECDNHARAYYQRQLVGSDNRVDRRVIVCENHVLNEADLNEVLRHELIHAIDDSAVCSGWKCNFNKIDDRSCSEIRAAYWYVLSFDWL